MSLGGGGGGRGTYSCDYNLTCIYFYRPFFSHSYICIFLNFYLYKKIFCYRPIDIVVVYAMHTYQG